MGLDNIDLINVKASDHGVIIVITLAILGISVGRFMENQQIGNREKKTTGVHIKLNQIQTNLVTPAFLFHSTWRNRTTS